jgi:guanylate kinase
VTTRAPRGQERDGVDYRFVDAQRFQEQIDRGEFVEWAEVHGHFYGSPRAVVDEANAKKGIAVFDIDVQGGNALKRKFPDAVLVFVLPPSMKELERRLRERGTDGDDVIRKRMLAARSEVEKGVSSYDYIVVNDDFERAYRDLQAIITAERSRRFRVDLSHLHLDPPAS